jgi:hypothetical protein
VVAVRRLFRLDLLGALIRAGLVVGAPFLGAGIRGTVAAELIIGAHIVRGRRGTARRMYRHWRCGFGACRCRQSAGDSHGGHGDCGVVLAVMGIPRVARSILEVGAPPLVTGVDGAVAPEVVVTADVISALALAFSLRGSASSLQSGSVGQAGSGGKENGSDCGMHVRCLSMVGLTGVVG